MHSVINIFPLLRSYKLKRKQALKCDSRVCLSLSLYRWLRPRKTSNRVDSPNHHWVLIVLNRRASKEENKWNQLMQFNQAWACTQLSPSVETRSNTNFRFVSPNIFTLLLHISTSCTSDSSKLSNECQLSSCTVIKNSKVHAADWSAKSVVRVSCHPVYTKCAKILQQEGVDYETLF